jgi:hypothetical protein
MMSSTKAISTGQNRPFDQIPEADHADEQNEGLHFI